MTFNSQHKISLFTKILSLSLVVLFVVSIPFAAIAQDEPPGAPPGTPPSVPGNPNTGTGVYAAYCGFGSESVITYDCRTPFYGNTSAEAMQKCRSSCGIGANCVVNPPQCANSNEVVSTETLSAAADKAGEALTSWGERIVLQTIIWVFQFLNFIMTYVVGLAGKLLDGALYVSMAPFSDVTFIQIGWTIVRDIANIIFIFALLLIAIGIILQLETFGSKKLLPTLIIAALLVNFSLVIGSAIIDLTNVIGISFIQKMYPVSDKIMTMIQLTKFQDVTNEPPPLTNLSSTPAGGAKQAISNLNGAFAPSETIVNAYTDAEANQNNKQVTQTVLQVLLFVMQVVVSFVMIGIGIMLISRTVFLMVLLVLSPFGFVFFVLPKTQAYASQWWTYLFRQSFFFPATAFFLYLAVAFGMEIFKNVAWVGNTSNNLGIIFNFITIIVFLVLALRMGQQFGIYGAAAVTSYGERQAKRVGGWVKSGAVFTGGLALGAATAPVRVAGSSVKQFASGKASQYESSTGPGATFLKAIPGVQRGLSNLAASERAAIKASEKNYDKFTSDELKRRLSNVTMSRRERAAILNVIAGRGDISYEHGLTREQTRQDMQHMRDVGMSVGSIERQDLRLVQPRAGETLEQAQARVARKITAKDIENMDNGFLQNPVGGGEDTALAGIMAGSVTPGALKALADKGGANQVAIQNALHSFSTQVSHAADDIAGVTYALDQLGNRALANYLRSTAGMRAYGFRQYPTSGGGTTGGTTTPPPPPPGGGGTNPTGSTTSPQGGPGGNPGGTAGGRNNNAAGGGAAYTQQQGSTLYTRQNFGGNPRP
jgi:hypothetical protein